MPRSICVHPDHQPGVTLALKRQGFLTQGDLAAHLEIALSTVSNFFRGLNVSVSKFEQICEALELDRKAIVQPQSANSSQPPLESSLHFFAYNRGWVGREALITELESKLKGTCRLLLIGGIAGIGKTALAERLLIELQKNDTNYILQPLRANFDDQENLKDFVSFATHLLEACGQTVTSEERKNQQQLQQRLIQQLRDHQSIVIIDSLEEILEGNETEGWSEFKDEAFVGFFQSLLTTGSLKSRVMITSQELPAQLLTIANRYPNFWHVQALSGLTPMEQLALFEQSGLETQVLSIERSYLARIGNAYEGHPLALRIIAGEMGSSPFYGNVGAYWQRYGSEIEEVEQAIAAAQDGKIQGAEDEWKLDRFTRTLRRSVRSRLEKTLMRLKTDAVSAYLLLCEASIYRCSVPEDWWLSHLDYWDYGEDEQLAALDALRDRYLVEESLEDNQCLVRQHNLIRSVSLEHLKRLGNDDGKSSPA